MGSMNIVVAVDGSKRSNQAVDFLLKLPFRKNPRIAVVQVVDYMALTHPLISPRLQIQYGKLMQEEIRKIRTASRKNTERAADRLKKRWPRVVPLVAEGRAAEKILAVSGRFGADLIVLGSRGLGHVPSLFLGSVSSKVVMEAECSVLVIKKDPRRIRKVLMAVDGSPDSALMARFVSAHWPRSGWKGTLLNVRDLSFGRPGMSVPLIESRYGRPLNRAGVRLKTVSRSGYAAKEIVATAKKEKMNLVVVGSRGFTRLKEVILGGVSSRVVTNAPCSVLVVKKGPSKGRGRRTR